MPNYYQLDRTKDFGEISPPDGLAVYEQNGFLYGANGTLIEARLSKEQKATLKKLEARAEAAAAADKVRREKLTAAGFSDDEIAGDDAAERKAAEPRSRGTGDIDLKAWLVGDKDYPFDKVRDAIRTLYGKQCTKFIDASDFLAEELRVPMANVRAVG